jgi:uncharacterized protein
MDTAAVARKQVITYLVLTFAFSSWFYYLIIEAGKMKMGPVYGLMWCPGVAALLTRLIYQRNLRGFGWGWGKTRYQIASYLLPPLAALAVYGLVWASGLGGVSGEKLTTGVAKELGGVSVPLPVILLLLATVGFLMSITSAMGEEIGWRGLLVPELAKTASFTRTALLSGAIWSVYHYPLILFSDYNARTTPAWFSLTAFTVMVLAASFGFAWLRLKSGSVWTAVFLHASHNLFIQQIFDNLTVDRGSTRYFTTEFGAGMALAYVLIAWYVWRRRGELPQVRQEAPEPALEPAPAVP